jgi:hypothetical protein
MKPTTIAEIVGTFQEAVALAVKRWLDDNRPEVLAAVKQGLAEGKALADRRRSKGAEREEAGKDKPYLTPTLLAARWGFHVVSVWRMIRRERWPVAWIGRRIRIPLAFVEEYEAEATVRRGSG